MAEMGSAGTLGDVLMARRRRRFVGRASEIELFRAALDSVEPPFSVLHVHGPPGIGKTRLLDVLAGLVQRGLERFRFLRYHGRGAEDERHREHSPHHHHSPVSAVRHTV